MTRQVAGDQIADDEVLLRRIPGSQMPNGLLTKRSPTWFKPHPERDISGISLFREAVHQPGDIRPTSGKPFYIARLTAKQIRSLGLEVVARPTNEHRGHAEIPALCSETRGDDRTEEASKRLANLAALSGPYAYPEPETS